VRGFTDTREFVENYNWSQGYITDPINTPPDRFASISGVNNYRSGKLATFEQMKMLRDKYGVRRIVNLAKDSLSHQEDERFNCKGTSVPCEPLWAEKLGIEYYPIYMGTDPPSEEDWKLIQSLLAKGGTLFHCHAGVDRTGAIAASWRKKTEPNLSNEEVLDYTYTFGGQWLLPEDRNAKLRAWLTSQEYDDSLRKKVEMSLRMPYIIGAVGVIGVGALIYYFRNELMELV